MILDKTSENIKYDKPINIIIHFREDKILLKRGKK